jgi:hypothetical protein
MDMDANELNCRFTYHKPVGSQPEVYQELRNAAKSLATKFDLYCPDSREKSLAMTKVEEAVMWANAAIARRS